MYLQMTRKVYSAASKFASGHRPRRSKEYYLDGTKANAVELSINSGIKTVRKIEITARQNVNSNWSDWF